MVMPMNQMAQFTLTFNSIERNSNMVNWKE